MRRQPPLMNAADGWLDCVSWLHSCSPAKGWKLLLKVLGMLGIKGCPCGRTGLGTEPLPVWVARQVPKGDPGHRRDDLSFHPHRQSGHAMASRDPGSGSKWHISLLQLVITKTSNAEVN